MSMSNAWRMHVQPKAEMVCVRYCFLTQVPSELLELKQLVTLDLSNNELIALPEEIIRLKNLRKLLLSTNHFTTLPLSFCKFAYLETLTLSNNELSEMAIDEARLDKIKTLSVLYLAQNKLKAVPQTLCKMNKLKRLNLADNEISSLPKEMSQMAQLKWLVLSGNRLTIKETEVLLQLPELSALAISRNSMSPNEELVFMCNMRERMEILSLSYIPTEARIRKEELYKVPLSHVELLDINPPSNINTPANLSPVREALNSLPVVPESSLADAGEFDSSLSLDRKTLESIETKRIVDSSIRGTLNSLDCKATISDSHLTLESANQTELRSPDNAGPSTSVPSAIGSILSLNPDHVAQGSTLHEADKSSFSSLKSISAKPLGPSNLTTTITTALPPPPIDSLTVPATDTYSEQASLDYHSAAEDTPRARDAPRPLSQEMLDSIVQDVKELRSNLQMDLPPLTAHPPDSGNHLSSNEAKRCTKCDLPLGKKFVNAAQHLWHEDCFRCCVCNNLLNDTFLLDPAQSVDESGVPLIYDEKCFPTFNQNCAACKQPIEADYLEFEGQLYHPQHLRCSLCDIQLGMDGSLFSKVLAHDNEWKVICSDCCTKMT